MTITPAQYSKAQRRLLATLGGLGVAALAAGTFVLSYDDLRLLALRGGAEQHWAFLYPGMLDGLVVVIILAILGARRSGWFSRAVRWLLLVILIAGAGAASVQRAVKGYAALPDTWVNVGVAVAPWAILILAVWLWVAMFRHVRSLRSRRPDGALSGPDGVDGSPAPTGAGVEPVPATVVDESIIPGLENETRPLARPASIRELEPVRTAAPQPAENPWEAARLAPDPTEEDTEPVPVSAGGRATWDEPAVREPETARDRPVNGSWQEPAPPAHAEPSDPIPSSWRENETRETETRENEPDDAAGVATEEPAARPWPDEEPEHVEPAAPAPTGEEVSGSRPRPEPSDPVPPSWGAAEPGTSGTAGETAASDRPGESADEEPKPLLPQPLLPPTLRRTEPPSGKPVEQTEPPAADATEPDSQVEVPVNDKPAQPAGEDPRPRLVARTSLPTDVRLVGPKQRPSLTDTQPDGIKLPDTNPDGIPIVGSAQDVDDEDEAYADERAEDPDAGMESTPPSSKFRSSPTPPRG